MSSPSTSPSPSPSPRSPSPSPSPSPIGAPTSSTQLVRLGWNAPFGDFDLLPRKRDERGRFCGHHPGAFTEACDVDREWQRDAEANLDQVGGAYGFGPETLSVATLPVGEYLIGVEYFGVEQAFTNEVVDASIEIVFGDRVYLMASHPMLSVPRSGLSNYWEAALLSWDGDEICVVNIDTSEGLCTSRCTGVGCDECASDDDCGAGLFCCAERCARRPMCGDDDDCASDFCSPVFESCVIPECGADEDCAGNDVCSPLTRACVLPTLP